jgi:hypothetical protein
MRNAKSQLRALKAMHKLASELACGSVENEMRIAKLIGAEIFAAAQARTLHTVRGTHLIHLAEIAIPLIEKIVELELALKRKRGAAAPQRRLQ